ncbi:MAG: SHOCT domain-containing protein [Deltaproteobacteria bacterium]|nr:SHOCT domain-containing protein [Deltaproteobacteria bacterium]
MGAFVTRAKTLLVPGELVEAWVAQSRLFALMRRRTVVIATSSRLMVFERRLISGYSMIEIQWQDLKNINLSEGTFGSTLLLEVFGTTEFARHYKVSRTIVLGGLRKAQARDVYRICQTQELAWREKRRVRELEEARAKSGGISMPASMPAGSDPTERLSKAKEMRDKGLISDAEFETLKAKIISEL